MPRGRRKKKEEINLNTKYVYGLVAAVFLFGTLVFNVTETGYTRFLAAVGSTTYVVDASGGGDFTTIQSCSNTATSGNTCLVKAGVYDERVTTKNAGVTYKASGQVIMNGFYITRPNTTVDGFTIRRYASDDPNQIGMIQIRKWRDDDGSSCRIVNNVIGPGVYAVASDYTLTALTDTRAEITSNSVNFLSKGFKPGIEIYIGTRSYDPPLNHDLYATVLDVTANKLTVESAIPITRSSAEIGNETHLPRDRAFRSESNFLAVLFAIPHKDKFGMRAIAMDARLTSGQYTSPSNCYIGYNLITDHMGQQIQLAGDGHTIEHNEITGGHGFTAIAFTQGRNNTIRYNYIHNGHSPFTIDWIRNGQVDRNSGYYWDFSGNVIAYFGGSQYAVFQNNVVDHNFIMGIDDQLTKFDAYEADERGLIFTNNIYVDVRMGSAGFSLNDMKVRDNIFLRAPYAHNSAFPISPSGGSSLSKLTGMEVTNNIFIDIGDSSTNENRGWYSVTNAEVYEDHNFISGAPADGYPSKNADLVNQPNTILGGDPKFKNINNPLGPDGRPWTSDDGLIPLAGSPLCGAGVNGTTIGPYECEGSGSTNTETTNTTNTGNANTGSTDTGSTQTTNTSNTSTGNNTTNTSTGNNTTHTITETTNTYTPTHTANTVPAVAVETFVPKHFSVVVKEGQIVSIPLNENSSGVEILIDRFPNKGSLNVTERFGIDTLVEYTARIGATGLDFFTYYLVNASGERSIARGAVTVSVQKDRSIVIPVAEPITETPAPVQNTSPVLTVRVVEAPSVSAVVPVQSVRETTQREAEAQVVEQTRSEVALEDVLSTEEVEFNEDEPGVVDTIRIQISRAFVGLVESLRSVFRLP